MTDPRRLLDDVTRASDAHAAAAVRMAETVLADRSRGWTWARMPVVTLVTCCVLGALLLAVLALRHP